MQSVNDPEVHVWSSGVASFDKPYVTSFSGFY